MISPADSLKNVSVAAKPLRDISTSVLGHIIEQRSMIETPIMGLLSLAISAVVNASPTPPKLVLFGSFILTSFPDLAIFL